MGGQRVYAVVMRIPGREEVQLSRHGRRAEAVDEARLWQLHSPCPWMFELRRWAKGEIWIPTPLAPVLN
jgi:hypothetical protein